MRKFKLHILILGVTLVLSFLSGCIAGLDKDIQLTEEQEANIEMIIKWREEWKEYKDFVDCVPANRIHIAEVSTKDDETYAFMTVGYVKEDPGTNVEAFVAKGYLVKADYFAYIDDMTHRDWFSDCITIDLENMTDDDLREVLRESYIAYLEKEE